MKSHGPGLSFLRIGLPTLHKGERSIIPLRRYGDRNRRFRERPFTEPGTCYAMPWLCTLSLILLISPVLPRGSAEVMMISSGHCHLAKLPATLVAIEDRQPSYLDIGHITLRSETTDRFGSCSSIMEISRHQVRGRAGQPAGHLEVVPICANPRAEAGAKGYNPPGSALRGVTT